MIFGGDRFPVNQVRRKLVPMSDDSVRRNALGNIKTAFFFFSRSTVVSGSLVGMYVRQFGTVDVIKIVQILKYEGPS